MISPRAVALILLAAGLGLGTAADRIPERTPTTHDGRVVLNVDFHVHGFPGDGFIGPWNLAREARRRGLHAIVLSNHNQLLAARLGRWWSRSFGGTIIFAGQEVTHPGQHIVAVGIDQVVDWNRPPSAIIDDIHAQGGLAIAAHPVLAYHRSFDPESLRKLDGAERLHPQIYYRPTARAELGDFYRQASQQRDRPLAAVGSSDFHTAAILGRCRTFVFARGLTEAAILDAVREGRTSPFADGDPAPAYATAVAQPKLGLGGVLGALGLLGVVLFGFAAPPDRAGRNKSGSRVS